MNASVLFLTHVPPFPASSGDAVRNLNLMRQLKAYGWQVSLFSLAPEGLLEPAHQEVLMGLCENVVIVPVRASRMQRAARVATATLLGRAYQPGYFWDPAAMSVLQAHLETHHYDVQMMQIAYMARYAEALGLENTVFDTHNAERLRLELMASLNPRSLRGLSARLQMKPAEKLERLIASRTLRTLAVSAEDLAYFDALAPTKVELIANGVDIAAFRYRNVQPATNRLLFMGSLDYSANIDAVHTLARDIMPLVADPDIIAEVAGRHPPPSLLKLGAANLRLHGFVENIETLSNYSRMMVVPLRFGGGTRLKVLEAFARGIPVVSTSVGCAGLGAEDGEHLLIADSPAEFATAIRRLLEDDDLCWRLASAGRRLAETRFDWREIGRSLDRLLRAQVEGTSSVQLAA